MAKGTSPAPRFSTATTAAAPAWWAWCALPPPGSCLCHLPVLPHLYYCGGSGLVSLVRPASPGLLPLPPACASPPLLSSVCQCTWGFESSLVGGTLWSRTFHIVPGELCTEGARKFCCLLWKYISGYVGNLKLGEKKKNKNKIGGGELKFCLKCNLFFFFFLVTFRCNSHL